MDFLVGIHFFKPVAIETGDFMPFKTIQPALMEIKQQQESSLYTVLVFYAFLYIKLIVCRHTEA